MNEKSILKDTRAVLVDKLKVSRCSRVRPITTGIYFDMPNDLFLLRNSTTSGRYCIRIII